MRLEYVRHLSGPNVYTTAPVSIARLELGELTCRETTEYPGFAEQMTIGGRAPEVGELWKNPNLANTLERIAKEGRDFVETIHEICGIVQGPT